jgi:hypothetical protein
MLEQYGKAYLIQHYIIPEKVQEYVKEHVTIE